MKKNKNKRLEIRLTEDLENKIYTLMSKLGFRTKTDLLTYLILKEFDYRS